MDTNVLAHNVRAWVHYDNALAALTKQVAAARKQRDAMEEQIKIMLSQHKMLLSEIQISGGKLQFQEERTASALSMKSLADSSEAFFKNYPEIKNPQKMSTEYISFLKEHRTYSNSTRLKKLK